MVSQFTGSLFCMQIQQLSELSFSELRQVTYLTENWNSLKPYLFKICRTRTIQEFDSGTVQSSFSCSNSLRWVLSRKAYRTGHEAARTFWHKYLLVHPCPKKKKKSRTFECPSKKKKASSRLWPWKPSLEIDLEESLKGTALVTFLELECFEYVCSRAACHNFHLIIILRKEIIFKFHLEIARKSHSFVDLINVMKN